MELLLIRHALPLRVERTSGPADPSLSPLGRRQADAVADWLVGDTDRAPIDAVVSSPLARARETAAPLAARLGVEPSIVDGVSEWDRHASSYVPIEEMQLEAHPEWAAMTEGRWGDLGVDVFAFRERVVEAVDGVVARHPGGRVAVVCHGGVINAYVSSVLGLGDPVFFEPTYTGVTRVLASRGGHRMLASLNETAHLRGVGVHPGASATAGAAQPAGPSGASSGPS